MINDKYLSILNQIKKDGGLVEHNNPDDKVLIIDGLNTFIRVFSVVPITNDDGAHVGGIIGFLKSIGFAIKMHNPTRCIIVFDGEGGSDRRRKLFPDYKANRDAPPEELSKQFPYFEPLVDAFNISSIRIPGFEDELL